MSAQCVATAEIFWSLPSVPKMTAAGYTDVDLAAAYVDLISDRVTDIVRSAGQDVAKKLTDLTVPQLYGNIGLNVQMVDQLRKLHDVASFTVSTAPSIEEALAARGEHSRNMHFAITINHLRAQKGT